MMVGHDGAEQMVRAGDRDPAFQNEHEVQVAVLHQLRLRLDGTLGGAAYQMIEPFGLDCVVVLRTEEGAKFRFLEFKAFKGSRQGGVGFGTPKGNGPQVDLMLLSEDLLSALTPTIRWCFADLTKPPGEKRFSLLTNAQVRSAVMGVPAHGKQNNFRIKDIFAAPTAWDEMLTAIHNFVLS